MTTLFKKLIPDSEIIFSFARSSGAGGQNVNKTSTKAILHWSVGNSSVYTLDEKNRIRKKLSNRLNNDDEIVIMAEEERSQFQNRLNAVERLQNEVNDALVIPKRRRATKPTYSSKLKRLEGKKKHSTVKKSRQVKLNNHNGIL